MRERLHLDVYNVIIAALIPVMLLTAWGLTTAYERNLRTEQCEQAVAYLEEVTGITGLYTSASSIDDAAPWLQRMQEMSYPAPATDLHNGAVSAFTYAATMNLNVDIAAPGGMYDRLTTFQDVLDEGRATLVARCPETDTMITGAFPMFFREEGQ
jgi:hypothetical protein